MPEEGRKRGRRKGREVEEKDLEKKAKHEEGSERDGRVREMQRLDKSKNFELSKVQANINKLWRL